jgi:hypothetical protein
MVETRYAELQERLEARLRELEVEIAVLEMKVEAFRLVRDALAREESREAAKARAGTSPWFEEILAAVWTTF